MGDKNNEEKKKKNPPPTAKSLRRRKKRGPAAAVKIPQGLHWCYISIIRTISLAHLTFCRICSVFPTSKCKLRLLKLERIKDYLLMEQEFIQNQELRKPREEQNDVSRQRRLHPAYVQPSELYPNSIYFSERAGEGGRLARHTHVCGHTGGVDR